MKNFLPIILFFIAFQLKSQTTITWTGNQDSLWNNSLNWSPTQIPNTSNHVVIPNTSIAPQVNVSATILNLTVNSGATIKLNSLLKVRGNLSLNSCNVLGNNTLRADSVASDSLSARNINITNATVSVVISLSGSTINLNGSTFNSKVDARRYNLNNAAFGSSLNGGNAFNQKFSFINKARSQTRFGVTNPDVFNDTVDIKNFNNIFIMAHSSQGNEFKKQVKFFLSIQQDPYGAIYIGDQINSNAKFYDNIIYTSLHNNIVFLPVLRLGSNTSGWIELAENKTIVTGNSPMIELQLTKFKKLGSDSFIINNNQLSVLVANRSVFEGPVNWTLNSIRLNGGYFNKNVTIFSNSNRSFPNNISEGNNYFTENFEINRSTNHVYNLANTNPDTCLGNYAVRSTTQQFGSYNVFVNSSGNIIYGDLIAQGVGCNFAINQIASVKILGNFIATNQNFNTSFNGITFGNSNGFTELEGNITINNGNPSSSFISFKNFRKKSANSVTFTNHNGQSWSPIRIENCPEWRGDLNIFGLGAVLNNSTFYGKVKIDLNRLLPQSNGSISSSGGNVFHSKVTLINNVTGSTPIILTGNIPVMHWTWASTLTDTYLDTLFIEKSNSSNLNFVTNGQAILKSSMVVNDLSTNKIKFAEGTGKIIFSGDKNQTITSTSNKSIQIKNLEINKENNFVTANDSLLITGSLALTNGVLKAPHVTKPIEIRQNSTITGGNNFSYIDGYVLNRQNSIKYFPVGHNNRFMPVYSDSVSASLQLKIRYRNVNSNLVNAHSNRSSFSDSISTREYWEVLQNNNPNSTINLNFAFDTLNLCSTENSFDIHAAQTKPTIWNKLNQNGISPLNENKVLLNFTLDNQTTSKITFAKNAEWCFTLQHLEICALLENENNRSSCSCDNLLTLTSQIPANMNNYHSLNSELFQPANLSNLVPIKEISVSYVVLTSASASSNDQLNFDNSQENFLTEIIEGYPAYPELSVNYRLANNGLQVPAIFDQINNINDSRIRLKVKNIRFVKVPDYLFYLDNLINTRSQIVQYVENIIGPCLWNEIPIFLAYGSINNSGSKGFANIPDCNLSTNHFVFTSGAYQDYLNSVVYQNDFNGSLNILTSHFYHEFGHILDINHTYNSCDNDDNPLHIDYLDDIYGPTLEDPNDIHDCPIPQGSTNNFIGGRIDIGGINGLNASPKQFAKMHRALSLKSPRKFVSNCPYSNTPIVISSNQIWNIDIRIYNDILVKSGNILTISCYVELPDQAKIIVEPGARLIIDGGKLTSSCNMWQGIQVLGIPTSNQGSFITTLQGYVELKNNALIENAHEGIFMGTNSGTSKQGGIVNAKDATFKNCFRGIAFNPYKFISISKIDNCHFICDRPLNDDSYTDENNRKLGTKHHVSMWGINGVLFLNNTFENLIDYSYDVDACTQVSGSFAPDIRGDGIACFDASVRLIGTNANNIDTRNVFKGLTHGISYNQTFNDVSRNISSINSLFENVQYGIYAANNWNASLNNNEFKVPGYDDPLSLNNPQTYGAYFFNYNNLIASNSNFSRYNDGYLPLNRGLILRGYNEKKFNYLNNYANIENNTFDGMKYAFQAERSNSNARLRCNSFNNTQSGGYPWHIAPQFPGYFPDQGEGCGQNQYRSGNYFLEEETEHIFSNAWNPWVYYAVNLGLRIPEFSTSFFSGFTELCNNANNDPCSTTNGPNWTASQAITIVKQSKTNQGNIKSSQDSIKNSLDHGKTMQMINLVEDLLVSRNDLTDSLMLHQPLSNYVLHSLTERDSLLSNAQLKMVLSPNLPLDDSIVQPVFEFINRKHSTTIDTLYALQVFNPTSTTIASLEREKRVEKYNELEAVQYVESMFVDSLEYDKLIALYRDTLSADSSYLFPLLGTYLAADSVTSARSLLEDLHIQEFITESFYNYYDLVIGLSEDTLTWFQLDSAKVALLKTIANEESDLALYAQAALELRGDTIIKRHPEESLSGPSGRYSSSEENNTLKISKTEFKLFPNPSNGFIMLESNKRLNELCRIELVDISGRIIYLSNIDFRERNINQINLSGIGSGIYFCRILSNGKQLEVLKFIHQP